jgi:protein-L-isoaspartate(D-aspartate) O-methyltransferase
MSSKYVLTDFQHLRDEMVRKQLINRDISSSKVLEAMSAVPREQFLPLEMRGFAYEDSPLPIAEGQTISQPYIVALMIDALNLQGGERVLEIGVGSGYASTVLAEIADQVIGIERIPTLSDQAKTVLKQLGYNNIKIINANGTIGYVEAAPYDAILVSAGGPEIPTTLKKQLKIGGRLVIPIGNRLYQRLLRVTRIDENQFDEEVISQVHFVPLIGQEGWSDDLNTSSTKRSSSASLSAGKDQSENAVRHKTQTIEALIAEAAQPIDTIETVDLSPLLDRIGESRLVLLGEATHGTSEFYRFRARLTQQLIEQKGFNMVAVEADWPDAARIDHYVREHSTPPSEWRAFARFPTWMWRNTDMQEFVEWLRRHNAMQAKPNLKVGFYGLDLYSMFSSIDEVINYLEAVDPQAAEIARERYGCLTPWQSDPATYGRAAASGEYNKCEDSVVDMLVSIMEKQAEYMANDGESFLDAMQNARLVANAEAYYRSMYKGYTSSWNMRDSHMFDTICSLLDFKQQHDEKPAKIVIWEHNSHIGDARATSMSARGEHNVGQLCRSKFGDDAYLIGFGTHGGTVAAADNWGESMQVKTIRPSMEGSWERVCHDTDIPAFMLGLRKPESKELKKHLLEERPERAIGVIYRPQTELTSHYFQARLRKQFDEYIWFDQTEAVTPLDYEAMQGMPDTYPFGL